MGENNEIRSRGCRKCRGVFMMDAMQIQDHEAACDEGQRKSSAGPEHRQSDSADGSMMTRSRR